MRHNKSGRKLGRNSSHRRAMMRNMVTSLFEAEKIVTTDARAKELRKIAERMISLGKRGDLHARRQAAAVLRDKKAVAKLFDMIGPRYANRPGGYTRIIKLANRQGDNASQSIIELVEEEFTPKVKAAKPKAEPKQAQPTVDRKAEAAGPAPEETAAEEAPAEEAAAVEEGKED